MEVPCCPKCANRIDIVPNTKCEELHDELYMSYKVRRKEEMEEFQNFRMVSTTCMILILKFLQVNTMAWLPNIIEFFPIIA